MSEKFFMWSILHNQWLGKSGNYVSEIEKAQRVDRVTAQDLANRRDSLNELPVFLPVPTHFMVQ